MRTNWKKLLCLTIGMLMLAFALAACTPSNQEASKNDGTPITPTIPDDTPPSDGTPPDASIPTNDGTSPSAAQGTEIGLTVVNGELCVTYVTYNGDHNPIEERAFLLHSPDSYYVNRYEYNEDGLLIGVTSMAYSNRNYRDVESRYVVTYTLDGKNYVSSTVYYGEKAADHMLSTVEYYANGTIKKWSVSENGKTCVGFSMDESGRRTLAVEEDKQLVGTYAGDSRVPTAVTYQDGNRTQEITVSDTDGMLSGITATLAIGNSAVMYERYYEFEWSTAPDGKSPALVFERMRMSKEATDSIETVLEMTYTDSGLPASFSFEIYQNETWKNKEVSTFEYDAVFGRMTKQTVETFKQGNDTDLCDLRTVIALAYDAKGNRTMITETQLGRLGQDFLSVLSEKTEKMEYNADGLLTKRILVMESPNGDVVKHEVEEYVYNAQKHCIRKIRKILDGEGTLLEEFRTELDEKGNTTKREELRYSEDGEVMGHTVETWSYAYYENGTRKTSTQLTLHYSWGDISFKRKAVMEFGENGEQTKETVYLYENPYDRNEITDTQVYYD